MAEETIEQIKARLAREDETALERERMARAEAEVDSLKVQAAEAWLGTREEFDAAWPEMRKDLLKRRATSAAEKSKSAQMRRLLSSF
jgi:hypothetical protein